MKVKPPKRQERKQKCEVLGKEGEAMIKGEVSVRF